MNHQMLSRLLVLLSDRSFVSGECLGEHLGITRAAVWKQLQGLEKLGVVIESVKGKGYRLLYPVTLFNRQHILEALSATTQRVVNIETLLSTGSTNDEVKQKALPGYWLNICVADHQSAGRGRRGRQWESPLGSNCYYSLLWHTEQGFSALEGLSLVVGLALIKTLSSFAIEGLELKWPNDVLWQKKKLAGILVEVEGDANGLCKVIIGIGVNLSLPVAICQQIIQPVVDVQQIIGRVINKNVLVARLTEQLALYLKLFEEEGFCRFKQEWNYHNAYHHQPVVLQAGEATHHGLCLGVDDNGNLLVKTQKGEQCFSGGEISLRLNNQAVKEKSELHLITSAEPPN